ncbi:MAG: hypothetical protein M0Z41_14980 [Peptococcaceae bacterium]|jgi:hypothetical protein|nr:hypothetical protein [Peptococcaceae bacterium]
MKVYTFMVYLGGLPQKKPDPPWRKIEIAGSRTLDDLHEATFDAFDREGDTCVYAFFTGRFECDPHEGIKYTSPEGMTGRGERDSTETTVESLGLKVGEYLRYVFNFPAEWWHVVEVTDIEEREEGALRYPRVIEKRGESPGPEDWVAYLNSALLFPFEAEVSECQDDGPLRMGDRLVVGKVVREDDKYGVLVEGRVGRRKFHFALIDLELVDQDSPNRRAVDEYKEWFPRG